MSDAVPGDFTRDLVRWSESLAAIARTGLGFSDNIYERERFEEVLHVAADIKAAADEALEVSRERDHFVQEWMESVGEGVPGYVTPKVAVGAVVGNEAGEILLVQRADSGVWLYPTGWADVSYSPAEVVVKEVFEETGIHCDPVQSGGGHRRPTNGFTRFCDVPVAVPLHGHRRRPRRPPAGDGRRRLVRSRCVAVAVRRRELVGSNGLRGDRRTTADDSVRRAALADVARPTELVLSGVSRRRRLGRVGIARLQPSTRRC